MMEQQPVTKLPPVDKKPYVFHEGRASDRAMLEAMLEPLKTYTMGDHAKVRLVEREPTDEEASHTQRLRNYEPRTLSIVMDSWASQYSTTIEKMRTAVEFFERGWRARDAVEKAKADAQAAAVKLARKDFVVIRCVRPDRLETDFIVGGVETHLRRSARGKITLVPRRAATEFKNEAKAIEMLMSDRLGLPAWRSWQEVFVIDPADR